VGGGGGGGGEGGSWAEGGRGGAPRSMTFSHSVRKSCSRSCVCRRRSPPQKPPPPSFICSACSPSASLTSSCSASLRKPAPAKPSPPPPPLPVAGRCRARGCWLYGLCSICWLAAWRSGLPVDGRRLLAGHVLDCPKAWLACGERVGWSSVEGEGEVRARVWARVGEGKEAWRGAWPARAWRPQGLGRARAEACGQRTPPVYSAGRTPPLRRSYSAPPAPPSTTGPSR
jgi:hypothetical protein